MVLFHWARETIKGFNGWSMSKRSIQGCGRKVQFSSPLSWSCQCQPWKTGRASKLTMEYPRSPRFQSVLDEPPQQKSMLPLSWPILSFRGLHLHCKFHIATVLIPSMPTKKIPNVPIPGKTPMSHSCCFNLYPSWHSSPKIILKSSCKSQFHHGSGQIIRIC